MTEQEKLEKFTDTIECEHPEHVKPDTVLKDIDEWDSMAMISVITMLATKFGRTLTYDELKGLVHVSDVLVLMENA